MFDKEKVYMTFISTFRWLFYIFKTCNYSRLLFSWFI